MRSLATSVMSAVLGVPHAPNHIAGRRNLDANAIDYARACRARGQGWQCIAHQLRVNETSLRLALGDLKADAEGNVVTREDGVAPSASVAPYSPEAGGVMMRALKLVVRGVSTPAELAKVMACTLRQANERIGYLKVHGFVSGAVKTGGYQVTDKGHAHLLKLKFGAATAAVADA